VRTRKRQSQFRYKGLTTGEFAERTGQSPQQVRDMISSGWFGWMETEDGSVPECLDVSSPGSKVPSWRIHPTALQRYYQQRAAPKGTAA
jgi:hypothetical protein